MFFILGYYIYFYLGLISYLIYLLQYANKVHLRYRIYLLGIKLTNKIREKIDDNKYEIIKRIFMNMMVYTELIHGFVEGLSMSKPLVELKKYSCIEIQTDKMSEPVPIIKEIIKEKIIEKIIEKPIFKERISEIKVEDTKSKKRSKSNSSNVEDSETNKSNKSKKSVFIKMKKSEYDGFTESEVDFGGKDISKKRKKKTKENTSNEESIKTSNRVKVSIASRY